MDGRLQIWMKDWKNGWRIGKMDGGLKKWIKDKNNFLNRYLLLIARMLQFSQL